jgi:inner membrane protein
VGALIAALFAWPLAGRRVRFVRLYLYAFLGYALAGFLDACTSYGTHLWWPFSDARAAWSVIAIVDPLFTATLAAAVIAGAVARRARPARIGLALAALYLVAGAVQRERAETLAHQLAASRGHLPERLALKPTVGNIVLWRSTYVAGGVAHADAIRPALLGAARVYPGESTPLVDPERDPGLPPRGSRARHDLERFNALSGGMVARDPARPQLLGDVRYAMLPTSVEPLWGIVLPADPAHHVDFVKNRNLTPEKRARFVAMLLGDDGPS